MLRIDNVANCYAKKLRTAMKWVDLIGLKKSVILNATFLLAEQCCEPLCERFALLGIRRKKESLRTAMRFNVKKIGQNDANR